MTMSKLVVFDIDGTLLDHIGSGHPGNDRFAKAIKEIFNKDTSITKNYNGWIDRQIAWDLVKDRGFSRIQYEEKFSDLSHALHKYDRIQVENRESQYIVIPGATELLSILSKQPNIILGLLTGNVERMAWWKLAHTGLKNYFRFGMFGDEVDDRIELAHSVFEKAKRKLGITFRPEQVIVIGDTVYDIRCGKAIGAKTIGVMTGGHTTWEVMERESPNLLLDTLADPRVYRFFGL